MINRIRGYNIEYWSYIEGSGARLFMCFNNKKLHWLFACVWRLLLQLWVYWSFLNELTSLGNFIIQCNTACGSSFHPLNFPLPNFCPANKWSCIHGRPETTFGTCLWHAGCTSGTISSLDVFFQLRIEESLSTLGCLLVLSNYCH